MPQEHSKHRIHCSLVVILRMAHLANFLMRKTESWQQWILVNSRGELPGEVINLPSGLG